MDTLVQIQTIKSQLDMMKLQLNNIEIQNNNNQMMNPMMLNSIGEQLLNLGIQLLNTGINAFNIGKNISMNYFNYCGELKNISNKINLIINENNIQQQFMMNQQIMMPNQMGPFGPFNQAENENFIIHKKNIVFKDTFNNKILIQAKLGTTIGELLNQYINRKNLNNTVYNEQKLGFFYNGDILERNDTRKVEEVFMFDRVKIFVNI